MARRQLDFFNEPVGNGGDVAQLVRASDRHVADTGSISRGGEEFFSQSQLSVQTLLRAPYTSTCNRMHLHLFAR